MKESASDEWWVDLGERNTLSRELGKGSALSIPAVPSPCRTDSVIYVYTFFLIKKKVF